MLFVINKLYHLVMYSIINEMKDDYIYHHHSSPKPRCHQSKLLIWQGIAVDVMVYQEYSC